MRAAILGIALIVGGVAHADASGARGHFLAGLELYGQGKYEAALAEYQAAWLTWQDPELLLDMAECNRHLGKLDEAREQYRGFLARAPQSPLRGSVERQLARLDRQDAEAPPPAELVAAAPSAPPPVERPSHAGRAAMAAGIAGWIASTAAFGVSLYTWSQYSALENATHVDLALLRTPVPPSPEEQQFFQSPSCSPPPSLMGTAQYRSDCTRGQQFSAATTGLMISTLLVGAGATASFIVGAYQRAKARGIEVQPAVSYNAAQLSLRIPF